MKRTLNDFLQTSDKKKQSTLKKIKSNSEVSGAPVKQISSYKTDSEIGGLYIIENIIDVAEERKLVKFIDSQKWNDEISRRTQHYGVSYNYGARGVKEALKVPPVPSEFSDLLEEIKNKEGLDSIRNLMEGIDFKQVIINEYKGAKQGISKHVDHCQDFGPLILILSLGDECVMKFHKLEQVKEEDLKKKKVKRTEVSPSECYDRRMPRRSLIILSGDARYQYQHEIPKTMVFKIDGKQFLKRSESYRRVSITYRSLTTD
ncbi:hypothetical protein NAEGRDRAFT_58773 [Naegleria gruberi]|uniref:Alpha-ketoglutarate-dependent dioxygenase AlkB-like domain-containing protein n=1 Tax=Naegleria gruberi TaxID=5762 RepID=D2VNR1_NAEGR|nr:uncharacterized protein NAEGRDRAFT_58773 [Naegleria gruberi]EFC41455.1 hypothetical protein NAEGRDRAFT_58773 [Naegleria gruberi]|eukprot:XP_002674199.1 hypothetical protein NAEGRDRAFT_58773 [Naegleria gruberi strain NEG-M]